MAIDIDVLVIGGGAQGLWLLNDLKKRHYRSVLLERRSLGCGQTCHSHAQIHRGHYYDNIDMMVILNTAAQFWQSFSETKGIAKLNDEPALAGFGPGTPVDQFSYYWRSAGLKYRRCPQPEWPAVLHGGKVRSVFATDEFSLDASELVASLAEDVDHCIYKIADRDDAIDFELEHHAVARVTADLEGTVAEFRRALSYWPPA